MTTCVLHHSVQCRATCSRPAESVIHVLLHNLKPAPGSKLAKVKQLGLWVLVNGRNAAIKCGSFHWLSSSLDIGEIKLCLRTVGLVSSSDRQSAIGESGKSSESPLPASRLLLLSR